MREGILQLERPSGETWTAGYDTNSAKRAEVGRTWTNPVNRELLPVPTATPQAVEIGSVLPHGVRPPRALIGVQFDYFASTPKIKDVLPGLGAEMVGLKAGDVIVAVNALAVTNREQVVEALREFREGQKVKLRIQRQDTQFTVEVRMMVPAPANEASHQEVFGVAG